MGLNAVVYRNKRHLKVGPDEEHARLVPETGEVYFESEQLSRKHHNQLKAVEHRLGNTAEIGALREEAVRLIGPESVTVQTVLRSGTHSGDAIPVESISSLAAEVNSIRDASQKSPELQRFIDSLKELIRAAKDEGNPIVFV
ncbi:MAG: hypothetical protein WBE73_01685 [Candidatus Acidiferrum sp.]